MYVEILFLFAGSLKFHSESEMDALAKLQAYGSDDSDDDFYGFDLIGGSGERFGSSRISAELDVETIPAESRMIAEPDVESFPAESAERNDDSDGSFFGSPRKKTKKEIQKEDSAKKRKAAHGIIMKNCGCRKKCLDHLSRDDREKINEAYRNLDTEGQRSYIQNYVCFASVKSRLKTRKAAIELRKNRSYICTLPTASDVPVTVCRAFFLNTIGFGKHCG